MTDQSKSVYASAPFKFIVDGEPLYIHADLVSLHSEPLDRMINGYMAEAQKGFATLEDVDYGTFVRFIEWAHRGYYTAAEHVNIEIESSCSSRGQNGDEVVSVPKGEQDAGTIHPPLEEPDDEPAVEADILPTRDRPSKMKLKKVKKAFGGNPTWEDDDWVPRKGRAQKMKGDLKEAFISRRYSARQSVFEVPPPRPNQDPKEDYTDVFLSHAQLYVFAEKYDIQPLKYLALEELHATLAIYTLYPRRTGDIIALLRYVYGNTGQSDGGEEELRQVLTVYIGYEMDTLMDDEDFRDLMIEDRGPLLSDFLTMVERRIS